MVQHCCIMQPSSDKPSQLRVDCVTFAECSDSTHCCGGVSLCECVPVCLNMCGSEMGRGGGSGMFGVCGHRSMCMTQWRPSHTVLKAFIHGRPQSPGSVQCKKYKDKSKCDESHFLEKRILNWDLNDLRMCLFLKKLREALHFAAPGYKLWRRYHDSISTQVSHVRKHNLTSQTLN